MAAWEPAPALAANFQLIRVVDGSTNPTPPDYITFRNVLFPNGVQTFPAISNPILQGHNIYGTDFIRVNQGAQPTWQCFYCGWQNAGQVNDRIYLRTSDDLEPAGPWTSPQVLVDNGVYEHACDPNVVVDENGRYHMLYTSFGNAAGGSARDWINYSTSLDGVNWTPNSGTVASEIALLDPNNISAGTIQQIARPALVKAGDTWKMWFDLKSNDNGVARQYSYLAESAGPTPTEFTLVHRYASHNNFPGFYEPDVQLRDDGTYIAVFQRHFSEIFMATSPDGINWQLEQNPIISKDHPLHPTNYISNPGFLYDQTTDTNFGVSFGMPTNSLLNDNDIGFAYSQYPIYVRSNGTVLHATAGSTVMTEQRVFTSGYSTFDTVVVTDPETGEILLQQSFSGAHRGDVWELQRVPAGDFDGDGDADGGDLLVWQRGLGTIYGPDDLEAWKSSFGMNASASTTVIPEPTALTIALGSVTLLAIRSRARFSW